MFIDASAMVAIIAGDEAAADLVAQLETSRTPRFVSPLGVCEAIRLLADRLADQRGGAVGTEQFDQAQSLVATFIETVEAKEALISADLGRKVVELETRKNLPVLLIS